MAVSMVRRRIAGYVKANPRSKKKHAPLPKRSEEETMVGEAAIVSRPFVAPVRRPPPTFFERAWKPAAGVLGALLALTIGILIFNSPGRSSSYSSYRETTTSPAPQSYTGPGTSPRRNGGAAQEYPGNGGAAPPISLADRALPTDESFRATAYVRKKVNLPNISGECVISGGNAKDFGDCLRRQGG